MNLIVRVASALVLRGGLLPSPRLMAVLVYATALLAMLGISAAYNLWPVSSTKMGSAPARPFSDLPHDRGDLHTVDSAR